MKLNFKDPITTYKIESGDALAIKIVAVAHDKYWVAYWASSGLSDLEVAQRGIKLPEKQAEPLFYGMGIPGRPYKD